MHSRLRLPLSLPTILVMLGCVAAGVINPTPPRAIAVQAAKLYLKPDTGSAVVGSVEPGNLVAIFERSPGYARVFVHASGWMVDKGLVLLKNPKAPEILMGAAAQLQNEAETYSGQRQTALNAARLFFQIYEYFPHSPQAAEALYRGADIKWQLDMADLPLHQDPTSREFPDDHWLNKVKGKFPHTQWAARAAFVLLVKHFTCGVWSEKPHCIDKEISTYRDYLHNYPDSPDAARAAYEIVYRDAAAWTVYAPGGSHPDGGKASQYYNQTQQDADQVSGKYAATDWAARAQFVAFEVRQGIGVYEK